MKYIPLESFEAINSLLQGVEALGCLLTIRLEAYTCRHTKEEKQIATNLAQYYTNVQSTPPLSPSPFIASAGVVGAFGDMKLPPSVVLGSTAGGDGGASTCSIDGVTPAPSSVAGAAPPVTAEDIDERLVYMVAALNSMYEKDGYDFSVLTERDFLYRTSGYLRDEMDLTLRQLPESCQPAVLQFWPAIQEQVLDADQGCEVYEFNAPNCDPREETSIFSRQYFLYNRSRKILVSVLTYGEGNRYRGDDGYAHAALGPGGMVDPDFAFEDEDSHQRYASSAEPCEEEEEEGKYGGKNREFYGY